MAKKNDTSWPTLKTYSGLNLNKVALPLGGIGTGTVSLGGRGDLRDWELMSRPAKGYTPSLTQDLAPIYPFFAVWAKPKGAPAAARLLEGPYADDFEEAAMGSVAENHGMPRFDEATFEAAYPFGRVNLKDKSFPLGASLEAFNPLIPSDTEASSLPVVAFRIRLINTSAKAIDASVCFNLPNFIGDDGEKQSSNCFQWSEKMKTDKDNENLFRKSGELNGIFMRSNKLDPKDQTWGTLAIATDHKGTLTRRRNWASFDGGDLRQEFWDDFMEDGKLGDFTKKAEHHYHPSGTLCASFKVAAGKEKIVNFYLTWHFPNRTAWNKRLENEPDPCGTECGCDTTEDPDNVGNYYATLHDDAWDAMKKIVPQLPKLEKRTLTFVRALCESDLPEVLKEAALFNLSTLRSQTTFRIRSGHLCGFEGIFDHMGCCAGSCTHVWNYETATGGLFGDLATSMRDAEFRHSTNDKGEQQFRVALPFGRKQALPFLAADGQMGAIVRFYREWQRSGDDAFLKDLWPKVRKALEFCWIPGGWDGDQDGVMEGCQHNTMDVEYMGPNPQMTGWYLAALRAAEAMATYLGEDDFASKCGKMADLGTRKVEKLFNGDYYEHHITPLTKDQIAPGLLLQAGAAQAQDSSKPIRQLGAGCLVDQLVGVHQARLNGLGDVFSLKNQKKTLRSIKKYNFKKNFREHFNHLRSYVSRDDSGLLMATYPKGRRPERPFPYWNEVMTGFEYTAAAHMLSLGMERDGLSCIEAIRRRYDGRRRNPFNEAECGYHYARAMASWSALESWTGFHYSAVDKVMTFKPREGTFVWATGYAWGTITMKQRKGTWQADLKVCEGKIKTKKPRLSGVE